jgi:hypothetical protein
MFIFLVCLLHLLHYIFAHYLYLPLARWWLWYYPHAYMDGSAQIWAPSRVSCCIRKVEAPEMVNAACLLCSRRWSNVSWGSGASSGQACLFYVFCFLFFLPLLAHMSPPLLWASSSLLSLSLLYRCTQTRPSASFEARCISLWWNWSLRVSVIQTTNFLVFSLESHSFASAHCQASAHILLLWCDTIL